MAEGHRLPPFPSHLFRLALHAAARGRYEVYQRSDVVLRAHEPDRRLFIIKTGEVELRYVARKSALVRRRRCCHLTVAICDGGMAHLSATPRLQPPDTRAVG